MSFYLPVYQPDTHYFPKDVKHIHRPPVAELGLLLECRSNKSSFPVAIKNIHKESHTVLIVMLVTPSLFALR